MMIERSEIGRCFLEQLMISLLHGTKEKGHQKILVAAAQSITNAGLEVGFETTNSFFRAFKNLRDVFPREFMKNMRVLYEKDCEFTCLGAKGLGVLRIIPLAMARPKKIRGQPTITFQLRVSPSTIIPSNTAMAGNNNVEVDA